MGAALGSSLCCEPIAQKEFQQIETTHTDERVAVGFTAASRKLVGGKRPKVLRPLVPYIDFADAFPAGRLFYSLDTMAATDMATRATASAESSVPSLSAIAACHQPILFIVTEFVSGSVQDALCWCTSVSSSMAAHLQFVMGAVFSKLYARRWPAFHEAIRYAGRNDWAVLYREMLDGSTRCILEIYHRQKKRGFAMSAMPAWVQFDVKQNAYLVDYMSASAVLPEWIHVSEERRLRASPAAAAQRRPLAGGCTSDVAAPFRVFQGTKGLVPGMGVEVQWKMQERSPFGWWYGDLKEIHLEQDGKTAVASVTFRHFPNNSRWHKMDIRFGDSEIRDGAFGGFTGGIRPTTQAEQEVWLSLLPS